MVINHYRLIYTAHGVLWRNNRPMDNAPVLICDKTYFWQQTISLISLLWRRLLATASTRSACWVKPKFHYADFATKSGTSSRQSRGHKSWMSRTSWFVSATKSADTNHESPRTLSRTQIMKVVNVSPTQITKVRGLCRRPWNHESRRLKIDFVEIHSTMYSCRLLFGWFWLLK